MTPIARKVLDALWELSKDGTHKLRPKGLITRICSASDLGEIEVGLALAELRQEKMIFCSKWKATPTRPGAMLEVIPANRPTPLWLKEWREILKHPEISLEDAEQLESLAQSLAELTPDQKISFRDNLIQLRKEQSGLTDTPSYLLSAERFLASSKLLSTCKSAIKKFGINVDRFAPATKYMAVAGPPRPDAVVLVENPHAFEVAVQAGTRCAFACTYGFGLSLAREKGHGEMLVDALSAQARHIKGLVRKGNPPKVEKLLGHSNIYFWGDLDLSGLRIYDNLKLHLPSLRLSALYLPMIESLKKGFCHPYAKLVGKAGQKEEEKRKGELKDSLAAHLAELCFDQGVDQEVVQTGFLELADKDLSAVWNP